MAKHASTGFTGTGFSGAFTQRLQRAWLTRSALACVLLPLALVFAAATTLRRAAYRLGLWRARPLPVAVVVVGNLIVGGAGKTPTVIAIVTALRRNGYTPGIVSRGYGGGHHGALEVTPTLTAAECGDEPLLMRLRIGAPLVVARDRVAAVLCLLRLYPSVDVIVSDDGLQHLSLKRDAQVIVFDERGVGNGWLLPAGPLREALPRALPRRSLVVYNAVANSTPLPGTVARRSLAGAVSLDDWWRGEPASAAALLALRGRSVVAAAGVARPERFFGMLCEWGLDVVPLPLPDHFDYSTSPWPHDTVEVIVTEKDAIKLDSRRMGSVCVWVAPLDFAFDATFDNALIALLPPPGSRHGNTPVEPARLSGLQGPA